MPEISSPHSSKEWNNFLVSSKGSFLQSFFWGDFKRKFQNVERLEAREGDKIVGVCQFFEEKNIFGRYYFVPYGPVSTSKEIRKNLLEEVALRAEKEGISFIHTEPQEDTNYGRFSFFRIQPKITIIKDIDRSDEQLIKSFSSSTRYNIRYAKKRGVKMEQSSDIDSFVDLIKRTEKRQNFHSYQKDYFQRLIKKTPSSLYFAYHKSKPVAGLVALYFGETVFCLHSGIDYYERKLKAPSLLRFEVMKEARDRGVKRFDFWGIDEKRFPGVTSFKRGFRGTEVEYPAERDIPLKNINYLGYKVAKKLKTFY